MWCTSPYILSRPLHHSWIIITRMRGAPQIQQKIFIRAVVAPGQSVKRPQGREEIFFRARWPCSFYSSSFTDAMPLLYWQTLPPQYHHMMTTTTICLILSFPSFLPSRPPSLKSFSIVL
mmetsp:Transcript_28754/g.42639  ORF Transcript_28754/g.42639 Transcript_28754/m.42639 type:complete len:119 (-) Transcript_28754:516-872(-)